MQGKKIIAISTTLKGLNNLKQVFSVKQNIVPPLLRFIPKPRAKLLRPVLILDNSRVRVVFPYWHPLRIFCSESGQRYLGKYIFLPSFSFCLGISPAGRRTGANLSPQSRQGNYIDSIWSGIAQSGPCNNI